MLVQNRFLNIHTSEMHYYTAPLYIFWSKIIYQLYTRLNVMVTVPVYIRWSKIISQICTGRKYILLPQYKHRSIITVPASTHTSELRYYCPTSAHTPVDLWDRDHSTSFRICIIRLHFGQPFMFTILCKMQRYVLVM